MKRVLLSVISGTVVLGQLHTVGVLANSDVEIVNEELSAATSEVVSSDNIETQTVNQLPNIYADDKTIQVGDSFDFYEGVSMFDTEEGDITDSLYFFGDYDIEPLLANPVTKVGVYTIRYYGWDSSYEQVNHFREVTVIPVVTPEVEEVTTTDRVIAGKCHPFNTVIAEVNGRELNRTNTSESGYFTMSIPKQAEGTDIKIYSVNNGYKSTADYVTVVKGDVINEIVNIPDKNLLKEINYALGRDYSIKSVTQKDLALLENLEMRYYAASDLSGLEYAVNLKSLSVFLDKTVDLSPLSGLTKLTELSLINGENVINLDLNPIRDLKLTGISVGLNTHIDDLNVLSDITTLEELSIQGGENGDSLEFVRPLINLTYFEYNGQGVSDLSPLANLERLEFLNLRDNQIKDVSSLKGLKSLKYIDLSGNEISSIDYEVFKELTELTELYLGYNRITDYSALKQLPQLDGGMILYGQEITLPTVVAVDGKVELTNLLKPYDGESLVYTLSDGGVYKDGILTWENIRQSQTLTVAVESEFSDYTATITIPVTYKVTSFPDVEIGKWYTTHIQDFVSLGFVSGYWDGTFQPQNSITRAEFVKIVNKAFGLADKFTPVDDLPFTDLDSEWKFDELKIALAAGYITPATEFRHNAPINRQEAAKIVGYLLEDKLQTDLPLEFTDADEIAMWAKDYVSGLVQAGVLSKNETFRPMDSITRAEAVKMLNIARGLQ